MKYHHIRNATALLEYAETRLLVDPMLSPAGAMGPLRFRDGEPRRNPLVELPAGADALMSRATDVLITHEHPDHLDQVAIAWIKERELPVWSSRVDAPNLASKGLDAREIVDGSMGLSVEVVPGNHGTGVIGWMVNPVSGFYLAHPDEPSIYLTGDTIMTDTVMDAMSRLRPEIVVAPAGAANFGIGSDLLFSVDELVTLTKAAPSVVIFNHLEALDHCPTTRVGLAERLRDEGLDGRTRIPEDGETLSFESESGEQHEPAGGSDSRTPGFQKWLTARLLSGTK